MEFFPHGQQLQQPEFSTRNLLKRMKVKFLFTTDDPVDSLEYHQQIKRDNIGIEVLPGFRPDKVLKVDNIQSLLHYLERLSDASQIEINSFGALLKAVEKRHEYFHDNGCRIADYGIDYVPHTDCTFKEAEHIFGKLLQKKKK